VAFGAVRSSKPHQLFLDALGVFQRQDPADGIDLDTLPVGFGPPNLQDRRI